MAPASCLEPIDRACTAPMADEHRLLDLLPAGDRAPLEDALSRWLAAVEVWVGPYPRPISASRASTSAATSARGRGASFGTRTAPFEVT